MNWKSQSEKCFLDWLFVYLNVTGNCFELLFINSYTSNIKILIQNRLKNGKVQRFVYHIVAARF